MTILEMIIVVAIIGIFFMLARVGIIVINGLFQASAMAKVQQEAQLVLYSITKDVRNSYKIVSASSGTMVLQVYNTAAGYNLNDNPTLFNVNNVSTMTYRFTQNTKESYLRKTVVRSGVTVEDKKLLRNILLTPDNTNYMFQVCDSISFTTLLSTGCPIYGSVSYMATSPYDAVDIRFRMSPSFIKDANVEYTIKEMRRSNAQ